jgi:hypothetical protein
MRIKTPAAMARMAQISLSPGSAGEGPGRTGPIPMSQTASKGIPKRFGSLTASSFSGPFRA